MPYCFCTLVPPPSGILPPLMMAWPPISFSASTRITEEPASCATLEPRRHPNFRLRGGRSTRPFPRHHYSRKLAGEALARIPRHHAHRGVALWRRPSPVGAQWLDLAFADRERIEAVVNDRGRTDAD